MGLGRLRHVDFDLLEAKSGISIWQCRFCKAPLIYEKRWERFSRSVKSDKLYASCGAKLSYHICDKLASVDIRIDYGVK